MKKLFIFLFFLITNQSSAQLNFKIGYDATISNLDKVNAITKNYNEKISYLDKSFKPIHFLNGIEIGVRYRINFIAFEAGWNNRFITRKQLFYTNSTKDDRRTQTFNLSTQTFSLGSVVNIGNHFGFGANIDRNLFNISRKFDGQSRRLNIYDKSIGYNSATFFLQYEGEMNDVLHFALRPYFQMPLSAIIDVKPFQDKINPQSNLNLDDYNQDLTMFGLKLMFFNGRQKSKD